MKTPRPTVGVRVGCPVICGRRHVQYVQHHGITFSNDCSIDRSRTLQGVLYGVRWLHTFTRSSTTPYLMPLTAVLARPSASDWDVFTRSPQAATRRRPNTVKQEPSETPWEGGGVPTRPDRDNRVEGWFPPTRPEQSRRGHLLSSFTWLYGFWRCLTNHLTMHQIQKKPSCGDMPWEVYGQAGGYAGPEHRDSDYPRPPISGDLGLPLPLPSG